MTINRPIKQTPQRHQLLWFVLVSLALHGWVLAEWSATSQVTLGETASENITIQAVLTRPEPVVKKKTEQGAPPETKPQRRQTQVSTPATAKSRSNNPITEETVTASARRSPVPEPQSKAPQSEEPVIEEDALVGKNTSTTLSEPERRRLVGRIRLALSDHFRYPLQARRLGWQGEVVLAFRLEADGRILDAHIARSSGYGALDRAALEALGKVRVMRHEKHQGINLQLPVIYRLEG